MFVCFFLEHGIGTSLVCYTKFPPLKELYYVTTKLRKVNQIWVQIILLNVIIIRSVMTCQFVDCLNA